MGLKVFLGLLVAALSYALSHVIFALEKVTATFLTYAIPVFTGLLAAFMIPGDGEGGFAAIIVISLTLIGAVFTAAFHLLARLNAMEREISSLSEEMKT